MADSNLYLSPYETLPIAQANKYLWTFSSWSGTKIKPQWLELPMSRTSFHGPKDVRAIEVRPYTELNKKRNIFEI